MTLQHVAELAQQVVNDEGVLHALQQDPVRIRKPLNLSESQLRALVSAGSFTSARPALTTSQPVQSLANQIATLDVGTLYPPEGEGQFPAPGELPPVLLVPHGSPSSAPVAGVPPHPTFLPPHPPLSPMGNQAPHGYVPKTVAPHLGSVPATGHVPQTGRGPATPGSVPGTSGTPATPVGSGMSPQTGMGSPGTGRQSGASPNGGASHQGAGSQGQSGSQQGSNGGQFTLQNSGAPAAGCCDACSIAMISVVAQLSTTAQAAITAITAIAGIG